jgi:hypothetical protein
MSSNYAHDFLVAKFNVACKDWNQRNGQKKKKTSYINLLYNLTIVSYGLKVGTIYKKQQQL